MSRASLIKLIHTGTRFFGWDEDTRRAWMAKHVGKQSCSECNEAELSRLGDELRVLGFQPTATSKPPGGDGPGRPTKKQWALAAKLAQQKGLTGLDDCRLATLCRRVAKVDHPRFLDEGVPNFV